MNLSERLDAARRARSKGEIADKEVPDAATSGDAAGRGDPAPLLRMTIDDRTYDGTDLRTGEPLTSEDWREREDDPTRRLPSWNPNRANGNPRDDRQHIDDPVASLSIDNECEAEVIHLAAAEPSVDDGLELPPWANDTTPYTPGQATTGPEPNASSGCPSCGDLADLTYLDLIADKADLKCTGCGLQWSESATAHARKDL